MSQEIEAHHFCQSVHISSALISMSRGTLEQMAVYTSVKLLNNDDEDCDINTKTGKQMRNLLYAVMHYVHIQAQTLH